MGFQTLAIEQQAVEVWRVLGAVKTEFGKFGDVLDKVKRQLDTAGRTIDETGVRTRAMERKLRGVEQLPDAEAELVLDLGRRRASGGACRRATEDGRRPGSASAERTVLAELEPEDGVVTEPRRRFPVQPHRALHP